MSIWSRILQALSAAGDSLATFFTKRTADPERSIAFTIGVIALGAKMAKADGVVTSDEIAAFKKVFRVAETDLAAVARVFNLAKTDVRGYDFYARQLARLFKAKPGILEDVLDSLFHIAKADKTLHEREIEYLRSVAGIFGFDQVQFQRIKARHTGDEGQEHNFIILGLGADASNDEIRKAYRKLVREHHPDRHIAAGMPREMIEVATRRLAGINAAYDAIAKERGF